MKRIPISPDIAEQLRAAADRIVADARRLRFRPPFEHVPPFVTGELLPRYDVTAPETGRRSKTSPFLITKPRRNR